MIKCLLTEFGRAGRENIWLSVIKHGPRCARSVRHDLEPIIPVSSSSKQASQSSVPKKRRIVWSNLPVDKSFQSFCNLFSSCFI